MPILNTLEKGVTEYGRIYAIITALFLTLISCILIGYGIFLKFVKVDPNANLNLIEKTKATVTKNTTCADQKTNCPVDVSFNFQGTDINATIFAPPKEYKIGDLVPIVFNPDNTKNVMYESMSFQTVGVIMIVVGLIFIIASWTNVYFTSKYKTVAAVEGVGEIASTINNLVRRR